MENKNSEYTYGLQLVYTAGETTKVIKGSSKNIDALKYCAYKYAEMIFDVDPRVEFVDAFICGVDKTQTKMFEEHKTYAR